jgi:pimeloyl-ACP methyl ester carboxylesterase
MKLPRRSLLVHSAAAFALAAVSISPSGSVRAAPAQPKAPKSMTSSSVAYRYATVGGHKIFYREAGNPASPTIILLHGFPASSFMYRDLIPALADKFHVIAPDYIGFGQSDAPPASQFAYTFDSLTAHVTGLIDQLRLKSYVLYMQDYGGPVGFRIFTQRPDQVEGLIVQNANAYLDGVGNMPKAVFLPLWEKRDATTEAAARSFLQPDTTKFQYTVGATNPEAISPDNWTHDQALLDRPGTDAYQLDLLENYKTNVALYDSWHAALRAHHPRTLIVWGKHDPFFVPAGAEAFLRDLPQARLVWLDAGHFVLDENTPQVAAEIKAMFAAK